MYKEFYNEKAIMAAKGDLPPVDCAIFADTGNEPKMFMLI